MEDDGAGRVATVGSALGGIICAIGWYVWMAILLLPSHNDKYIWDCNAVNVTADQFVAPCEVSTGAYWAPGILMTLGVVMLNMIRWTALGDDMSMGDDGVATKAKLFVGVCFVIMFCSLGGGVWILVQARDAPGGCGLSGGGGGGEGSHQPQRVCRLWNSRWPGASQCGAHTLCGAHTQLASRCGRTGLGHRTTPTCGWARGSPSSCSASAYLWVG